MTRFNELGDIRRSQVVSTYGPGSIVDFRAGKSGDAAISVVAAGLETWEDVPADILESTKIYEPRLASLLHVQHFRLAPVASKPPKWQQTQASRCTLQGRRFPLWLQCPRCQKIGPVMRWKESPGDPSLTCPGCSKSGDPAHCVPVRFVMTCGRGHLDEFPWDRWVHQGSACRSEDLQLESRGGTGLASLFLKCGTCKAERSMDSALSKGTFEGWKCRGKRPWLDDHEEGCEETPVAVQRGASNLYFARTFSALDIPPWSHPLMRMLGANWEVLSTTPEDERGVVLKNLDRAHQYTKRLGMTQEQILEAVGTSTRLLQESSAESLRREEHLRLINPSLEAGPGHEFETRASPLPGSLIPYVSDLVEIRRLREVRALTGFTRIAPPSPEDEGEGSRIARLSRTDLGWLPAVEVRGEGIYLELNKARIADWQRDNQEKLRALVQSLQQRYERAWRDTGKETPPPERPINARHLLVHTLAHALIRQLSLDCGYSSASLRERLYVESGDYEMAGLLIYTGSSDADGTLGGLSRQAEPTRFQEFFVDAIRSLAWCSNDPLCIHGEASSEPLNRAACHSCALVAETSCETFNQLLDRSVLVGTPDNRNLGFFSKLLRSP